MANKRKIDNIPLIGPLELSKNKLDVIVPGDSGYIQNDAAYFGNVLSPVYKENTGADREYWDSDGNYFDLDTTTLSKNGNTVATFTNTHFVQEPVTYDDENLLDIDCYYEGSWSKILEDGLEFYNDENDCHMSLTLATLMMEFTINISNIITTKIIGDDIAVLYQDIDEYKLLVFRMNSSLSHYATWDLDWTEIGLPLITYYTFNSQKFICLFNDSGSEIATYQSTSVNAPVILRVSLDASTNKLLEVTLYSRNAGTTESVTTTTAYALADIFQSASREYASNSSSGSGSSKKYSVWRGQQTQLKVKSSWENPIDLTATVYYHVPNNEDAETTDWISFEDLFDHNPLDGSIVTSTSSLWGYRITVPNKLGYAGTSTYPSDETSAVCYSGSSTDSKNPVSISEANDVMGAFEINSTQASSTEAANLTSYYPWPTTTNKSGSYKGFLWIKLEYDANGTTTDRYFMWVPENTMDAGTSFKTYDAQTLVDGITGELYEITEDGISETASNISEITISTTTRVNVDPLVNCNGFLDDGTFVCTSLPSYSSEDLSYDKGSYGFTGTFYSYSSGSMYYTASEDNAVYLGMVQDSNVPYPYYFNSLSIALDKYHLRSCLVSKGWDNETETSLLFDSSLDSVLLNAGHNATTYQNYQGSLASVNNWRVLYNSNMITGLSYGTGNNIGTLLTDWNIIDKVYEITSSYIIYSNIYGDVYKITLETVSGKADYQVVLDRFIVINTPTYLNAWDIKKSRMVHWASDWNDRVFGGIPVEDNLLSTDDNTEYLSNYTTSGSNILASAQNANYEMTNNPITSYIPAAQVYLNMIGDEWTVLKGESREGVDIYWSASETTAPYVTSYRNGVFYKKSELDDAVYPSTVTYNPNIFTTFIATYNLNDLVINTATNTAYPLNKYNGQEIMNYELSNGLENAENVFVVQTLYYMISEDKIYEVIYSNGTVSNLSVCANIKGLQYLGCLPTQAIFWSPMDKCFWSFAGDAILRKIMQATDISEIYGSWYCTSTQELFVGTDFGLLCINDVMNYNLYDKTAVTDMWFMDDYFIVKNNNSDWKMAYCPEVLDVEGTWHLKTKWFGNIENYKSNFDCIYFRFDDDGVDGDKYVTIQSNTITDMGVESETKSVELDFDELTGTAYLRYQPQYQKAVAMQFIITSNTPLISWSIANTPMEETGAISTINI